MVKLNEVKEGMTVFLYSGTFCDVIESEGELYLIDGDSGEKIGKVKDQLKQIETYEGR